jgi:hypothetical protein
MMLDGDRLNGDDLDYVREHAREIAEQAREQAREQADQAREQAEQVREQMREQSDQIREQAREQAELAREQATEASRKFGLDMAGKFNYNFNFNGLTMPPMAFAPQSGQGFGAGRGASGNESTLYQRGQRAIDDRHWDEALADFTAVASRGGSRADGALFYKAYTLNKLGRRDESLAAIAELRKSYATSRWLDDAKALELEVKQASGPVSPDSETDDELKLLALNGLMQSDPDRAVPLLDKVLKGAHSPKLKKEALFVLASSTVPNAQQLLEQTARSGNPDLQVTAIRYLNQEKRKQGNNGQILSEIYASSNDINVKRAILDAYTSNRDNDHLLQIAKNEKDSNLRTSAFDYFSRNTGQPELWQVFQSETSQDVKITLLDRMYHNGNVDKLGEVARKDADPKVRREAIRVLSNQEANTGDALVSVYNAEQDPQVKRSILDDLSSKRNVVSLIAIARAEKDQQMKLRIVERLSNMASKSKEASDYLLEILGKP